MTTEPTQPPHVEAKPTWARDAQRAIRGALRGGQPVFVQATEGNVIGFQPYTTDATITLATVSANDTHGTTEATGPAFTRPARELVHVTGRHAGARPDGDHPAQWSIINEIAITAGGRIVIVDARRHNEAIVTGCTAFDIGYLSPLAQQWRAAESARRSGPAVWHSPISDYTDIVRDADGDIYAIYTTPEGALMVFDLTASEAAGNTVADYPAEVHWEGRTLVIESGSRAFQTAPITELDPQRRTVTPLAAEFVVRQHALLDRTSGRSSRQPGLTLER
jgi:hypothetical protein